MLGIDDNSKIIFYAGNLIPLKNVDILINAYSLIENKYSDTLLFIAGAGGEGSLKDFHQL